MAPLLPLRTLADYLDIPLRMPADGHVTDTSKGVGDL